MTGNLVNSNVQAARLGKSQYHSAWLPPIGFLGGRAVFAFDAVKYVRLGLVLFAVLRFCCSGTSTVVIYAILEVINSSVALGILLPSSLAFLKSCC